MNQYKSGDKVVIKTQEQDSESIYGNDKAVEQYIAGRNRIVTITKTTEGCVYSILIDGEWWIPETSILGYHFDYGEEIEVRDRESSNWIKMIFMGYADMGVFTTSNIGSLCAYCFKYWRPLQPKPTIEVTVKINGKETLPIEVSEQTWASLREVK